MQSQLAENNDDSKLEQYAEEMQSGCNLQSLREARYVGIGYNELRGAPEGAFSSGGVDPGVKINRHIFKFTYSQGKTQNFLGRNWCVPDQVNYQMLSSCASSSQRRAYSGTKSYQSDLAASVSAEGE